MYCQETSSLGLVKVDNANENLYNNGFNKMIDLCKNIDSFPLIYIKDMVDMYDKCTIDQKNSSILNKLIDDGLKNIFPNNKKSFQYAANVFNELLQLTKNESTNMKFNNCTASSSAENTSIQIDGSTEKKEENCSISLKLFNNFIEKCFQNSNFPRSNIEVIDQLYKSLPIEYTESEIFISLLTETNQKIWPDSGHSSYVYVEHIYEQLKQFKTSKESQEKNEKCSNNEARAKLKRQMEKLNRALNMVRKKIKLLEYREMSLSDDDAFDTDSAYILKDKYEKRAVKIYKRMCELRKEPDFLEQPSIRFKSTNNVLVNKTIEKYYNINKVFPDYFEVYTLLKKLNEKKNLNWSEKELSDISKDAFLKLGKQLKVSRLNDYFSRLSDMITEKDPAEDNEELKKKLEESNRKHCEDLNKLTKEFECKQEEQEETEGSSLNETECELSSSDEFNEKKIKNNVLRGKSKIIPTRKKQLLSPISKVDSNFDSTNAKSENILSKDLNFSNTELNSLNKIKSNSINETKQACESLDNDNKMPDKKLEEKCTIEEKNVTCNIDLNTQKECQSNNNIELNHSEKLKMNEVHSNISKTRLQSVPEVLEKTKNDEEKTSKNVDNFIEITDHDDSGSDLEITMYNVGDPGSVRKRMKFQNDCKTNSRAQVITRRKIQNNSTVTTSRTSKYQQFSLDNTSNKYQFPSNVNQNHNNIFNQQSQGSSIPSLPHPIFVKYLASSTPIQQNHSKTMRTNMQQHHRQITSNIVQQHKGYNRVTKMTTTTTTVVEQMAQQQINCYSNVKSSSRNSRRIIPQTNRSPELIELD